MRASPHKSVSIRNSSHDIARRPSRALANCTVGLATVAALNLSARQSVRSARKTHYVKLRGVKTCFRSSLASTTAAPSIS